MTEPNIGEFWRTIGQRAIGATIVTASGKDGPAGFLGLSATHVEAEPPTMLVSVGRKTSALATMLESRHFAVSFLPRSAAHLVDICGGKSDLKGAQRFEPGAWSTLATGAPVHADALGAFDCRLDEVIERKGSVILIGAVLAWSTRDAGEPLILFRNHAGTFAFEKRIDGS